MLLLLWRGDTPSGVEADLMGACLVAAIDHGPLLTLRPRCADDRVDAGDLDERARRRDPVVR